MIRKFLSRNSYPKDIVNAIIKHVLSKEALTTGVIINEEKDKIPVVFINLHYPGEKGKRVLRNLDAH